MDLFKRLNKKISPEIKYILLLFLSTRVVLTLIGVISRLLLEPFHGKEYVWIYSKYLWLDIWGVWDTGWYLDIANNGYSAIQRAYGQANYAFFPLYPMLMKLFGFITGNTFIAGIILSNICLIISCIYLYKLVKINNDEKTALSSVKYLFLFPTAFILSGVFTESLFIALCLMSFYYAKKSKWVFVGILGFFLALTKALGVFILFPLAYIYLDQRKFNFLKIKKDIFFLALIPLGLFSFSYYNYLLTGDFFSFYHILSAWNLHFKGPFSAIISGLLAKNLNFVFSAYFTLFFIFILALSYTKLDFSYWLYAFYSLLIPLCSSVFSMPRHLLIIFPFFIFFGRSWKNPMLDNILTLCLALVQGFLMIFWANGFHLII